MKQKKQTTKKINIELTNEELFYITNVVNCDVEEFINDKNYSCGYSVWANDKPITKIDVVRFRIKVYDKLKAIADKMAKSIFEEQKKEKKNETKIR